MSYDAFSKISALRVHVQSTSITCEINPDWDYCSQGIVIVELFGPQTLNLERLNIGSNIYIADSLSLPGMYTCRVTAFDKTFNSSEVAYYVKSEFY